MRTDSKDNLQRHYTLKDKVELAWFLFRTKLIDRNIRLLYWCHFEVFPTDADKRKRLILGDNIQMNDFVHICALDHVEIGDGCLFASHVYISDNSHGRYGGGKNESKQEMAPDHRELITAPVKIGNNCWLGEGVIVMPGVTIGDGCVIGAHSVVNKDIPEGCIAVGSPARVIKKYDKEQQRWLKVN